MNSALTFLDMAALGYFVGAWAIYHYLVERSKVGLNAVMARRRRDWMKMMARREVRMPDAITMQGLQNGSAFFASTSLIAIGGSFAALQAGEQAAEVFSALPFGITSTRELYDIKIVGLASIFAYAFFKFVWSYRLFNYGSILVVCTPPYEELDTPEMKVAIERAANMNVAAGRHFNRGLRAFFFVLAYLGWFVSPLVLTATTTVVAVLLWRRQFSSEPLGAATLGD